MFYSELFGSYLFLFLVFIARHHDCYLLKLLFCAILDQEINEKDLMGSEYMDHKGDANLTVAMLPHL